jgi:hypothetical protein
MSYFCQFCDKEMLFEGSIVYEQGYITCGGASCTSKAGKEYKALEEEYSVKTAKLLIFKSPTPEDNDTWRIVPKDEYPDFIRDTEVLKGLFEGYVIGLQKDEDTPAEMFYCARNTVEVLKQLSKEGVLDGA